jgi:hypothetical protein
MTPVAIQTDGWMVRAGRQIAAQIIGFLTPGYHVVGGRDCRSA